MHAKRTRTTTGRWHAALLFATASSLVAGELPEGALRAFVTSTAHTGNLGGLAGADAICQARATAAGLSPGDETFRAWLSTGSTDAWCRVQGLSGRRFDDPPCDGGTPSGAGPWAQVGETFAWSGALAELVTDGPLLPLSRDENGNDLGSSAGGEARTATFFDGTLSPFSATCSDFTTTSTVGGPVSAGVLEGTRSSWTQGGSGTCAESLPLYCLEIGTGPGLPGPGFEPAGLAFVTEAFDDGVSGGIVALDALCRTEAAAAGLPLADEFFVLMSDGTVDAFDRLADDVALRRVDDYAIADHRIDLFDGRIRTPIQLQADGARPSGTSLVWTGTADDGLADPLRCGEWASSSGSGRAGRLDLGTAAWVDGSSTACSQNARFYCALDRTILFWETFETGTLERWSGVQE